MYKDIFEDLKNSFYGLMPPYSGGGTTNQFSIDFSNPRTKIEDISIDMFEAQNIDYDYLKWMEEHPDIKFSKKVCAANKPERVELLLYTIREGTPEQKSWAYMRFWTEFVGLLKREIKKRNVPQELYDDVLQESYSLLLKRLPTMHYNKDLGAPSTYFMPTFLSVVTRAYSVFRNKTTSHYSEKIRKVNRAISDYQSSHNGEEPSLSVLKTMTGLKFCDIEEVHNMTNLNNYASLDEADCLSSPIDGPEEQAIKDDMHDKLIEALDRLPSDAREVMVTYFDLDEIEKKEPSYESVGKKLKMSTTRVKNLIETSLQALRKDKGLRSYYAKQERKVERITRSPKFVTFFQEISESGNRIFEGRLKKKEDDLEAKKA